jgi:hypothetical protein
VMEGSPLLSLCDLRENRFAIRLRPNARVINLFVYKYV